MRPLSERIRMNPHIVDQQMQYKWADEVALLEEKNKELLANLEDAIERGQLWGQPLDNAIEAIRKAKGE